MRISIKQDWDEKQGYLKYLHSIWLKKFYIIKYIKNYSNIFITEHHESEQSKEERSKEIKVKLTFDIPIFRSKVDEEN